MSSTTFRTYLVLALSSVILLGCRSKIDLDNIDTTSEVEMGVALPVGSISAKVGDFIEGISNIYVEDGVIVWRDTFNSTKNYHQIDLAQYISSDQFSLNVYEQLSASGKIGGDGKVTGDGNPMTLIFDLPLKLNGINNPDSLSSERIDSAQIDNASFASTLSLQGCNLDWDWINKVELDLGDQVSRKAGNIVTVYNRGDGGGYNQKISTAIDNFSICLMKNRNLNPDQHAIYYPTNVKDTCTFRVRLNFTIPNGTKMDVPSNSRILYNMDVQFIDYTAIWGMFAPSKDMRDEDTVDITESWGDFEFLSRARVPFAEPEINVHVHTHVAGALWLKGDYLFVEDIDNVITYATFNGAHQREEHYSKGEYLDPYTSLLTDSTDLTVLFDKDPKRGCIDKLFLNTPKNLGYKYNIDIDHMKTPQMRITPSTAVHVAADCKLPLIFNQGLHLDYSDTITDVNIGQYSIDSLLDEVDWVDTMKTTDVKLILKSKNTIPLCVKAYMRCLDENDNLLMDPSDPSKPLLLFPDDTIRLAPPTFNYAGGNWNITEPGETVIIANLTKEKLDLFPQIKSIIYTAVVDDESLDYAFKYNDKFKVRITDDARLTMKIGITAKVDAILNFDKEKE